MNLIGIANIRLCAAERDNVVVFPLTQQSLAKHAGCAKDRDSHGEYFTLLLRSARLCASCLDKALSIAGRQARAGLLPGCAPRYLE